MLFLNEAKVRDMEDQVFPCCKKATRETGKAGWVMHDLLKLYFFLEQELNVTLSCNQCYQW